MSHHKHEMSNSHVLTHDFDYIRPGSVKDLVTVLADNPQARILAGGTNLLVDLKLASSEKLASGPSALIDITGLDELRGIEPTDDGIRIGALTSIRDLAVSEPLWRDHTCLAEAAANFGSTQVMMMGTLGGNIANGSPASDTVPALVVLGAKALILGPSGERTALVADLLVGPGKVVLDPGEFITAVVLPKAPANTGSAFLKLTRVRADLAKVSVAVRVVKRDDTVVDVRIALGSVGPTVLRAKAASASLAGKAFSEEIVLDAARLAAGEITPIDDVRSTAAYRRKAAMAITFDALQEAWNRAEHGVKDVPRGRSTVTDAEPAPAEDTAVIEAGERIAIELVVNGTLYELDVAPNDLLLNVLRERLQLTGAKYGCGIGECGACTVWMNGSPVLGCLVLAISAHGAEILTVEGLASQDGTLDPLQEAFVQENAFQCGYCTPGMLMMSKKLLEEIADPTEAEIREYLKGNYCRCTGYASVVRAVHSAAKKATS